ncbi:unnamed protein product [Thelazia callipaeda]|uniref:MKRN2 opposite strand protein n=1 Tax=Thelazia callipaeda TaxID=103827 RepID=A0A0N5D960_THECL|nr:unnamed protein product [Thelazia callipaeda]
MVLVLVHSECGWCCVTKMYAPDFQSCPKCGIEIEDTMLLSTFQPNLYVSTALNCCCILLKPSSDTFERYKLGDNLHIGLSNSNGVVFSYTKQGLVAESFWNDCLCIYKFSNNEMYDMRMKTFIKKYRNRFTHKVQYDHYDEKNWNCYDFVVEFLLDAGILKWSTQIKDQFVAEYICKALQKILRYYSLLDKLSQGKANCFVLS